MWLDMRLIFKFHLQCIGRAVSRQNLRMVNMMHLQLPFLLSKASCLGECSNENSPEVNSELSSVAPPSINNFFKSLVIVTT
jgi:hypothetical protein